MWVNPTQRNCAMSGWNARTGDPGTKVSVPQTTDSEAQRPRLIDVLPRRVRPVGSAMAWVTCVKVADASAFRAALVVSRHRALDGSEQPYSTDRDFLSPFLAALDGLESETMVVLDDVHLITDGSTIDGLGHVTDQAPDRLNDVLGQRRARLPPPLTLGYRSLAGDRPSARAWPQRSCVHA